MTREEAKELLLHILMTYEPKDQYGDYDDPEPYEQALTMAIEVLSANCTTEKQNDAVEQGNDIIDTPTDLISRADAIKSVANAIWHYPNECYKNLNDFGMAEALAKDALFVLPSADRPTELLQDGTLKVNVKNGAEVSRVLVWGDDGSGGLYYTDDRPSGEWVIRENGNKECSLCGHERQDGWDYFCGYCGAKMGSGGLYYEDNRLAVKWKPVSEGLPQSVGSYIVTCKDEYGSVYVDYDFWTVVEEFKYNCSKVTAWMPFPKPYCGADMRKEKNK